AIAVGQVGLVGGGIERDLGDAAKMLGALTVGGLARLPDRQQDLAVARELQDVRIALTVAANPDVVLVIDRDAVVRRGPLVSLAFTAPGVDEVALGVELEHRWSRRAALARLRRGGGTAFFGGDGLLPVDDEHVVARVD